MQVEPRLDYFIIWGHATPFLTDIVETIDTFPKIDILYIKTVDIVDRKQFIKDVHAKEWPSVPLEHTLAKTAFLHSVPAVATIALVMNREPKVRIQPNKNPLFHMPECIRIKQLKTLIREKFDPNKGGSGSIALVPNLHPDQHVVHASDFPEQIPNALKVFGLKPENYWREYWLALKGGVITNTPAPATVKEVTLDDILLKILSPEGGMQTIPIEISPHYKYLRGDKEDYESYWRQFCGRQLRENHSPTAFSRLSHDFSYLSPPYDKSLIKVRRNHSNYTSEDGDHRLAILKFQKATKVRVEVI